MSFDWPHAPTHRFAGDGVYFITAGTYLKRHYYRDRASLDRFVSLLFWLAKEHAIALQAWSAFSNHYHLVAQGLGEALSTMLRELHSREGRAVSRTQSTEGRRVWFQYRDTQLTYERSWLARLRYTHENPVKHGLVANAGDYPWCSAGWLERVASPSFVRSLKTFRIDRVNVVDDFEVEKPLA